MRVRASALGFRGARRSAVSVAVVAALAAAVTVVLPTAPAAAEVGTKPLTLIYDQQVYGDFLVAGNAVNVCPATPATDNANCLLGANDSTSSTTAQNNSFAMTATGAGSATSGIWNSSSAALTIPSGAKVAYAQLTWGGSLGRQGSVAACDGSTPVSTRPTNMPATATAANTTPLLKVGSNAAVAVTAQRENEDPSTTGGQLFYSAKADVTSLFANATTGSPLALTTSNVFAYQGRDCVGGWSVQVVYDFGQPTVAQPDKKEVFIYDGHVRITSGNPSSATISGFRAFGPAKVGVVAYEGDNGLSGDFFKINGTSQAEPRTGKTNNFFISNASGQTTPNYPNNYSTDAKTFNVPDTVIKPGDTSATLQFGTDADSYMAQELAVSVAVPSLRLEKTVSPSVVHAGDQVTFTIKVTNPTTSPVNSVVVDDPAVPACNKAIGTLAGGASTTYTCTYTASKDLTNTANVSGRSSFNDAITGTAFVDLRVLRPDIEITKTADATAYHVGDTVTFTVKVSNTGDTGLSNVVVTDAKTASCARVVGTLAAGDSTTYTCTSTAPVVGDSNTASVTGVDSLGGVKGTVTDTSTAPAPTIHPAITMTKSASPAVITAAGQQVTYSFKVTNTSTDAPLTGVSIKDTLAAPAGPEPTITCPATTLAPGASTTCTGTYTATQADVDKGTISNSATATGTDQVGRDYTSAPSTALVTVTQTKALSLVKSATPTSISSIGANVTYRFVVKNTGNTTVTNITVADVFTSPATDIPPTVTCPTTTLAPNAQVVCSATYTSVRDDFDNGSINNSATAGGTSPAGPVTSNVSTATVTTVQGPALTVDKSASPTAITAPGDITYSFAVTNSGSVTITNLQIVDTFTGGSAGNTVPAISCPVSRLPAGASTTCTATYPATQADVDRGSITNSAVATGTAPNGTSVQSLPSTATVTATRTPKLSLTKTVLPVTAAKAGDVVTYSFAVKNTGNVTVTALAITDPMFPGAAAPTCTTTTLAPNASTTCTKTYTVTQDDVDRGSISNTATAGGTGPGNTAVTSPPSTAKVTIASVAKLSLTKSVAPTSVTAAGQNVTYSFAVTNTGNVTVTALTIADTLTPPAGPDLTVTCPVTTLAPGASTTCTAPYKVTAADIDNGVVSNSATANGKNPSGDAVTSNTSTASVTAGAAPALSLTKSASPQTVSSVGQTVTYTFNVTNSGNVTLRTVAVNDPLISGVTCLTTTLAAGASTTCTGTYTVTQADLNRGSIVNTATVSGTTPKGANVTSPQASATVTATQSPALTLQKTASPAVVAVRGDKVTYTFTVRNTGNVTVNSLAITDTFSAPAGPPLDPITCLTTTLAPTASTTCSATYTATQDDIDAGAIDNSAKATGTTQTGRPVTSNTSTATVSASPQPGLTLAKSVTPTTVTTANTVTTYSFKVTNNGNQTITGLTIADPMFLGANAATCPVTTLAPGTSTTCTATRAVTQADVDAGSVTNTARATGTAPGGVAVSSNQSSAQVTIPRTAKLEVTKSPSPATVTAPGGKVTYTFTVRNTGNVTVRSIAVADTFTAPAGSLDADPVCQASTLAPNTSTTCSATYTVTQRDIDAGSIRNSATASGLDPTGATVTSPAATARVDVTKTASMTLLKKASVAGSATPVLTAAGQKINYTFDVTNTGNVTLSLLGVEDILEEPASRSISATCPTTTVPVGGTVTCTATYTVTQDDIDSGSVDNTATATARDPQGTGVTSNPSNASVGVTPTPSLEVKKSASPTTVTSAGQTVTYTFTVRNTGNVRLSTISIVDPMFTGANAATCPTAPLDPAATASCTATYTVTQADIDAGGIVNTARARAVPPSGPAVTSDPSTATVTATRTSALTLDKKAAPATVDTLGQTINYTFVVTNSGNTTITALAINDARLPAPGNATCPTAPLLPGRSATCTGTYTVTQADLNRGTIVNTATATGSGPGGTSAVSPQASATVDVTRKPSLSLVKSVTSGPITTAGQTISYNFAVQNTGNVSITVLAVIDRLTAPAGPPLDPITCADNTLEPRQTTNCTATYKVTQADVNNGSVTNSAYARAEDPSGTILTSPDSTATVPIAPRPGLTVVKSASPTSVTAAGQTITYNFLVTNTGNVTLSLLAVQDTFTKADGPELQVTCTRRTLDPTVSTTCSGTYVVTQRDIDAGSIENFGVASAKRPDGTNVDSPPSNGVVVSVTQSPALTLTKSASPATVTAAGQVVDYSFLVVNSGNTTVSGIAVADPMFTGARAASCPVTALAPRESTTCTASYAVTQDDLDRGSVTNVARATGTDPRGNAVTSPSSTATVTATQRAHLMLTKSANPQSINVIGTQVTYSFVVLNDGNLTVTGIVINDAMFTGANAPKCPNTTLAPNETVTCTATYDSTATDFNNGSIDNTATASGTAATGPVTSNQSTATVKANQNSALEVLKSASPAQVNAVGQVITYTFEVTNLGNVTITNLAIDDPMFTGADAANCPSRTLAAGGVTTCTATHTVTQADLDSATGKITNTAAATGTAPGSTPVRSQDSTANVAIEQKPALTVAKTANPTSISGPGTISYSFLVTNTGNVRIDSVAIVDPLVAGVACPQTSLEPRDTTTCTGTYAATQADVDRGSIKNTAYASGATPTGTATRSPSDTATVSVDQSPQLTLTKSITSTLPVTAVGQTITYRFELTNTGNVTITSPSIADTLAAPASPPLALSCPAVASLPARTGTLVCTSTYTVRRADLENGSVNNSAVGTGKGPDGADVPSNTSTATAPITRTYGLTIDKVADPATASKRGDIITYSFTVRNTGNVAVHNLVVTDTMTAPAQPNPSVGCPSTDLGAAGTATDTVICTARYGVKQADVDNGRIDNSAFATGTASGNPAVKSNTDTARVMIAAAPALTVAKTATPTTIDAVDQVVTYSFEVTNTGNVTLSGIGVTDKWTTAPAGETAPLVSCPRTVLAPTESVTCTATHTVTQDDLDLGVLRNSGVASGTPPTGGPVPSPPSTAEVTVSQKPALTVIKSADPQTVSVQGETVTYSFLVTNSGNVRIDGIAVADAFDATGAPLGPVDCPVTSLAPKATTTCTVDYEVTQPDLNRGVIANTATVSGTGAGGQATTSPPSSASVAVTQGPALTLEKSVSPDTVTKAGTDVTYSFHVTNSGNVSITDLSIDDTLAAPAGPALAVNCPVTALDPDEDTTCTATYRVTQGDVDHGSVDNSAVARGKAPQGGAVASPPSTAKVTIPRTTSLTIEKTASPATVTAAGQTVNYSFVVTNTGNTTITGIRVADTLSAPAGPALTVVCPDDTLAPTKSTTCTAKYAVTQDDVDHGSIHNSATASGAGPDGTRKTSDPDIADVQVTQNPSLTVAKSASVDEVSRVGQTITYSFLVTNAGNTTITGLTVADVFTAPAGPAATPSCPVSTLAPRAKTTCTVDYTVTPADLDHGAIDNVATASGKDPAGAVVDSPPDGAHVGVDVRPGISVLKKAALGDVDGDGKANLGDTITWTFEVTNTGNVSLDPVTISDVTAGDVTCPAGPLAAGDRTTCTANAVHLITQTDVDNGSVDNTATASGTDPFGTEVTSDPSSTSTKIPTDPSISLVKSVTSGAVTKAGQTVAYSFIVTNTGDTTISGVEVTDTLTAPAGPALVVDCPTASVAPNDSTTCTASYKVTQADVDHGVIDNAARATADAPGGRTVTSNRSAATVPIVSNPALTVLKSANRATVDAVGQTIEYSFLVTNTGNVTLDDISIDDTLSAPAAPALDVDCPTASVAPTRTTTCTATYSVTQKDLDHGAIDNSATASGTAPDNTTATSDPSTANVTADQSPALTIAKKADPLTVTTVGQQITYTFTVTNTGNVTVDDIAVDDTFTAPAGPEITPVCADETLAPKAKTTCTATYEASRADFDNGVIDNSAVATGTTGLGEDVTSDPSTATVTATPAPAVELKKTATPHDLDGDGRLGVDDTISYTFVVTNTGNVTLTMIGITDPLAGQVSCPTAPLPAGGTADCAADVDYVITQKDVDAGRVDNSAKVSGTDPFGTVVTDTDTTTTTLVARPGIALAKAGVAEDANDDGRVDAGDEVRWSFTVTNTGNVTLTGIAITDPVAGDVTCPLTSLAPGQAQVCTADVAHRVTQRDMDLGTVNNTATVAGTPPSGPPVDSSSSATVPLPGTPSLSLVKGASVDDRNDNGENDAGDVVTWTFLVTNRGNVTVTDIAVSDPTAGRITCPATTLAPGRQMTCRSAPHPITATESESGQIVNTATVGGKDPGGDSVTSPPSTKTVPTLGTGGEAGNDPGGNGNAPVGGGPAYTGAKDLPVFVWSGFLAVLLGMLLVAAGLIRRRRV